MEESPAREPRSSSRLASSSVVRLNSVIVYAQKMSTYKERCGVTHGGSGRLFTEAVGGLSHTPPPQFFSRRGAPYLYTSGTLQNDSVFHHRLDLVCKLHNDTISPSSGTDRVSHPRFFAVTEMLMKAVCRILFIGDELLRKIMNDEG